MKSYPVITTLKGFVNLYGAYKSDMEMASLLDISTNDVQTVKAEIIFELENNNLKKIGNIV